MEFEKKDITKNIKVNTILAEHQDEYHSLPINLNKETGQICFARKLTFRELLTLIFTRKILISILSFNKPMQPIRIDVSQKIFEESYDFNNKWIKGELDD